MREFLKSKLGIFFAGIYLLVIFLVILEQQNSRPHSMDGLGLLFLTAPWSFLFDILFESFGIMKQANVNTLLYIYVAFGGLINASILYLLGSLITKILGFFRPKENKLS